MKLTPGKHKWYAAALAVSVVAAMNLLILQSDIHLARAEGVDVDGVAAEPAPITGVRGPEFPRAFGESVESWGGITLSEPSLPALPPVALGGIRARARVWLGDGVIAAPTDEIHVEGPDAGALFGLEEAKLEAPVLVAPEWPPLPPIR